MRPATLSSDDLRAHFLGGEGGSLDMLDQNFAEAIRLSGTLHNHAVFLYHAVKNAISKERYGTDTGAAGDVIRARLRSWVDKALKFKGEPEPWVVPSTLTAFDMLSVRPPARYVEFCQEKAMRTLRRWEKSDVSSWFSASAHLTLSQRESFVRQLCQRTIALAPRMRGDELFDLARNMAIMDAVAEVQGNRTPVLAAAFHTIFNDPRVTIALDKVRHHEEPGKIEDAMYWFSRCRPLCRRAGAEKHSRLEERVSEKFREAGAKRLPGRTIRDTGHGIDLSFEFAGCTFDVEVDGPGHFIRCTDGHVMTLDGSSVFQTLLMRERDSNLKLVRLPYTVYYDYAEEADVWARLCRQVKSAEPGTYIVDSQGRLSANLLALCDAMPSGNRSRPGPFRNSAFSSPSYTQEASLR